MPQDYAFLSQEAARAHNYTWREWRAESPEVKARVLAHYMEKNLREGYAAERMEAEAGKKGGAGTPPPAQMPEWSRFRQGGGEKSGQD